MAYMQDVTVEKRRAILGNVKAVYKLRSSLIHHGRSVGVDDAKILTEFMLNVLPSLAARSRSLLLRSRGKNFSTAWRNVAWAVEL